MWTYIVYAITDSFLFHLRHGRRPSSSLSLGYLSSVSFYSKNGLAFDCFPYCGKVRKIGKDVYLSPYVAAQFIVVQGICMHLS